MGGTGRIGLYVDEVAPGNNLRPDRARAFYSFFWILLEYPDWYRSSAAGWHDICTVKASDVDAIPGGVSAIMANVLKLFWGEGEGWNLSTLGVRVAGPLHVRASFALFLMDERALNLRLAARERAGARCVYLVATASLASSLKMSQTAFMILRRLDWRDACLRPTRNYRLTPPI